jgi:hypothetical protein
MLMRWQAQPQRAATKHRARLRAIIAPLSLMTAELLVDWSREAVVASVGARMLLHPQPVLIAVNCDRVRYRALHRWGKQVKSRQSVLPRTLPWQQTLAFPLMPVCPRLISTGASKTPRVLPKSRHAPC